MVLLLILALILGILGVYYFIRLIKKNTIELDADGHIIAPQSMTLANAFRIGVHNRVGTAKGRATRKEFWLFMLSVVMFLATALLFSVGFVGTFLVLLNFEEEFLSMMPTLICILLLVGGLHWISPVVCAIIRRLHDIGLSGWWALLLLLPVLGNLILLILTLLPSKN